MDDAPLLMALIAITLGLVEALKIAVKAAWNKRNGGNPGNPHTFCKYDVAQAAVTKEKLTEIFRCLERIENHLRERRDR